MKKPRKIYITNFGREIIEKQAYDSGFLDAPAPSNKNRLKNVRKNLPSFSINSCQKPFTSSTINLYLSFGKC
jgi:hypothetical protein